MRGIGAALTLLLAAGCEDNPIEGVNLFTIEDDIALGAELRDAINADPETYGELLDPVEYADAYARLDDYTAQILASDDVRYAEEYPWEVYIIHDDEVLNAFAAPGGYIYVYTGLVHYLDEEDHFAGVMGHEIAHADRRHSTQQLTKAYGVSVLIGLLFGSDPGVIAEVANGLLSLTFSRADETQADEYSVLYLCDTPWAADGAAGFFAKILAEGGVEIPEFLSTHPSSESRVEDITARAEAEECSTELRPDADWAGFKALLPPVEGG